MSLNYGPIVYDSVNVKETLKTNGYTVIRKPDGSPLLDTLVWADVETDPTGAWFCIFVAFPRVTSPYVAGRVGTNSPTPFDTVQTKLSDNDIRTLLSSGFKETRTQWFHTSVEFGTVWADGSLTNNSTQYNLFENPNNWSSTSSSSGQRFKRKRGLEANYTDWITSASGGCSGAVGGWSNYYNQSCVQSWFAGCEGGPALNHRCAGGVQDRANQLIIWGR